MMGDSDPAFYEAASEAVQQIRPPEGLTLEELHEFWVWVEVHAYYERITNLAHMCGSFGTDYSASDARKLMVGEFAKAEDIRKLC